MEGRLAIGGSVGQWILGCTHYTQIHGAAPAPHYQCLVVYIFILKCCHTPELFYQESLQGVLQSSDSNARRRAIFHRSLLHRTRKHTQTLNASGNVGPRISIRHVQVHPEKTPTLSAATRVALGIHGLLAAQLRTCYK